MSKQNFPFNTEEDMNASINAFEQELKKLGKGLGGPLVKSERALLLTFSKWLTYEHFKPDNLS